MASFSDPLLLERRDKKQPLMTNSLIESSSSSDVTRSPAIHPPPYVAVPTTALLNARRLHLHTGGGDAACAGGALDSDDLQVSHTHARLADSSSGSSTIGTATTTQSSTPSINAVVMDTLVRRYRATENRLERWRHAGGGSRAATTAGAALRRQKKPHHQQSLNKAKAEEDGASANTLRHSLAGVSRSAMNSVLGCRTVARAVRSWWRQVWRGRVSAPSVTTTPILASAGKRVINPRAHRPWSTRVSRRGGAALSASWLRHTSQHLLDRLSSSLALSSDRGQSSQTELVDLTGNIQRPVSPDFEDEAETDAEEAWRPAPSAGDTYHSNRGNSAPAAVASLGNAAASADPDGSLVFPTSPFSSTAFDGGSSNSSNSSNTDEETESQNRSCEEWAGQQVDSSARRAATSQAALFAASPVDDGRFTLSWVRGLRHSVGGSVPDTTAAASPSPSSSTPLLAHDGGDAAEDSFRSASRLLAKSRARFARWLRRQRRAQAAKRALLAERWRRRFSPRGGRSAESSTSCSSLGAAAAASTEAVSATAVDSPCVGSDLARAVLRRGPSSWEQALPWNGAVEEGKAEGRHITSAAERASVRAALQRAIAAAEASQKLQHSSSYDNESSEHHNCSNSSTPHSSSSSKSNSVTPAATALSRAMQQEREHAGALARLKESLKALSHLRSSGQDANSWMEEEGRDGDPVLMSLNPVDARKGAEPTVLCSRHCTCVEQVRAATSDASVSSPQREKGRSSAPDTALLDDADVFRSLLVDTTHTPHDVAVRLVYEEVMRDVCTAQVRQAVDAVVGVSRSAADRALSQWVERQLLSELAALPANHNSSRNATPAGAITTTTATRPAPGSAQGVVFTGILQHIRSRVPVSLSSLCIDDVDRRALASVYERSNSDDTAASLQTAGYTITYRQLASLNAAEWLNDQVINNYLQLLCEDVESRQRQPRPQTSSNKTSGDDAAVPHSIASMGTHFYAKVESELTQSASSAAAGSSIGKLPSLAANSATLRWLRRRQHLLEPFSHANAASVRAVLIPVNIEAQHWALVVYYREDRRWVLYDSMSRSDRARQRGLLILERLSHIWRECQRHYGFPVDDAAPARASAGALVVAAAYTPSATKGRDGEAPRSPLDSLLPYGSLAELHRAANRLRHQMEQLEEDERCLEKGPAKLTRRDGAPLHISSASLTSATTLPASMLSDAEVEWFTDGFAHIPQQRNGNDCGVFVCQVAWCVANGVAVSFTQADITLLRQVITLELLSTKLLRRYPTEHTSSSAGV